jgi:hypothetical protein
MANPSPKGIIDQPNKANIKVIHGPITNSKLLDCLGIIISFTNNFRASATLYFKFLKFRPSHQI